MLNVMECGGNVRILVGHFLEDLKNGHTAYK